jgi:hypothetical protein
MFVTPLRPPPETSPEDKGLKKSVEKVVDSNDSSNKDEQTGTKKKNPDEAKTRQKRFGFAVPSFGPSYSYYGMLNLKRRQKY